MLKPRYKNELHPVLMSASAINGLHGNVSASRGAMLSNNLGQFLVINGATRRRFRSGMESLFADTTFKKEFKADVEVIKTIHRFPPTNSKDSIKYNPQTVVIYEEHDTMLVDVLNITKNHCLHQSFGFSYETTENYDRLAKGQRFNKGDVVAKSPIVTDDGDYKYGIETNVAFMSLPEGIEDGLLVSQSWLERIVPKRYEEVSFSVGKRHVPTNYNGVDDGDPTSFKIIPDIGEYVSPTGLLASVREYNETDAVVNMRPSALMDPDYIHDSTVYVHKGAKVVDIRVERNDKILKNTLCPTGTDAQLWKYYNAEMVFHKEILNAYWDLYKRRKDKLQIGVTFHRLVVEALAHLHSNPEFKDFPGNHLFKDYTVEKIYRNSTIDEFRVTVLLESESIPTKGFKITNVHGGKTVIVAVWPDEDMPIDKFGNRADIVMDDKSITKRINPATFVEQYVNASGRDVVKRICKGLGIKPDEMSRSALDQFFKDPSNATVIKEQLDYLLSWYQVVTPPLHDILMGEEYQSYPNALRDHLKHVVEDGHYIEHAVDNPVFIPEMIRVLKEQYRPDISPVYMRMGDGTHDWTEDDVLIGSVYMIVLEKTGEDWSAVSSPKLSHYGTTARLTNLDRNESPVRLQATKSLGETEVRALSAAMDPVEFADILDALNNPQVHKQQHRAVITADNPSDIESSTDREAIPVGGHRPANFVNHIFQSSGRRLTNNLEHQEKNNDLSST